MKPLDRWLRAVRRSDLTSTQKLCAWGLSHYMDFDTLCEASPGSRKLAADVSLDPRTVRKTLGDLEAAGWVRKVYEGGNYRGVASIYCGTFPAGAEPTKKPKKKKGLDGPWLGGVR